MKKMKHALLVLLVIMGMMVMPEQILAVEGDSFDTAIEVELGEEIFVEPYGGKYYKFTVPERGKVTFTVTRERMQNGSYSTFDFELFTSDEAYIVSDAFSVDEAGTMATLSFWYGLDAGEYYFSMGNLQDDGEDYLTITFEESDVYEVEPDNDKSSKSMNLELEKEYFGNTMMYPLNSGYDYYDINLQADRIYRFYLKNGAEFLDYAKNTREWLISNANQTWSGLISNVNRVENTNDLSYDLETTTTGNYLIGFMCKTNHWMDAIEYSLMVEDITCEIRGHKFLNEVIKAPTYTDAGWQKDTCTVCGHVVESEIEPLVGICPDEDGTLYYYSGGKIDTSYFGLCHYQGKDYYVNGGMVDLAYTGLILFGENWYYIEAGSVNYAYTGLVAHGGAWYYVQGGILNWGYTGLTCYNGTWYYVEGGVLNWAYTGLCLYGETWYYVEGGVLNWNYTGLSLYYGTWYYVENGMLNWNFSSLCLYGGSWYVIENGVLNWNYTDLYLYGGTWYYIEDGVLNWNYVGLCTYGETTYYVEGGVLRWDYTGLCYHNDAWYYVENGILNLVFDGLVNFGGNWYYVEDGCVNFDYTGLVYHYGTWYYINRGVLDWNYTGYTYYGGMRWYVENGILVGLA